MENFIRYPKIFALGHKENEDIFINPDDTIVIEEKIDGANFRFMIKNGNIIFGSRTQQLTSDNIAKNFMRCIEYVREQTKKCNLKDYGGMIFFGECCVKHTLTYDWDKIPPFLGFDVMSIKEHWFKCRKNVEKMYKELGLQCVPLIKMCSSKDITSYEDKDVPVSEYAPRSKPEQQCEGVVFKNEDTGIRAKYVRAEFKEENRTTFGGSVKYTEDDTGKVVCKYCVNPRIDKCIFKLIDEGLKLEMTLMKYLPRFVYRDIMEEHGNDILFSKMTINFQQLNKQITRRCLNVLQQVITNNALNKEVEK